MNDWYNANEHRCYPFIENRSPSESLPEKEIVDCRFFLKNAKDTTVYLSSREEIEVVEDGDTIQKIKYQFQTAKLNIIFLCSTIIFQQPE